MDLIVIAFGLLVTIVWIVIGWRAMKAHEALATEAKRYNDKIHSQYLNEATRDLIDQKQLYAKFLRDNPDADDLSPKERHLEFRAWLTENS